MIMIKTTPGTLSVIDLTRQITAARRAREMVGAALADAAAHGAAEAADVLVRTGRHLAEKLDRLTEQRQQALAEIQTSFASTPVDRLRVEAMDRLLADLDVDQRHPDISDSQIDEDPERWDGLS